jgi:hypothetical protein
MEDGINKILTFLEEKPRNIIGLRLLRIGFSLALFGKVISEAFVWKFLLTRAGPNYINEQGYLYEFFFSDFGRFCYVGLSLLGAITLLLDKYFYLGILFCCASYMASGLVMQYGHGGHAFARIMSVYLLLTIPNMSSRKNANSDMRVTFHNIGVGALYFQGMIVYFTSGISKIPGTVWQEGTALYYILSTERFGFSVLAPVIENAFIIPILTYSVIIFQLGFPFMIFSKFPFSIFWALLGIFIHMGIAVFMGLWLFSLVIISFTLFAISDKEWILLICKSKSLLSKFLPVKRPIASTVEE